MWIACYENILNAETSPLSRLHLTGAISTTSDRGNAKQAILECVEYACQDGYTPRLLCCIFVELQCVE